MNVQTVSVSSNSASAALPVNYDGNGTTILLTRTGDRTFAVEGSADGGTTWNWLRGTAGNALTSLTSSPLHYFVPGPIPLIRLNVTAGTTGTVTMRVVSA